MDFIIPQLTDDEKIKWAHIYGALCHVLSAERCAFHTVSPIAITATPFDRWRNWGIKLFKELLTSSEWRVGHPGQICMKVKTLLWWLCFAVFKQKCGSITCLRLTGFGLDILSLSQRVTATLFFFVLAFCRRQASWLQVTQIDAGSLKQTT